MLLHQVFSFNSPVWFNVGTSSPQQVTACQPYDALVSTPAGLVPIGKLVEDDAVGTKVYDAQGLTKILATKANGVKDVSVTPSRAGLRTWKVGGSRAPAGRVGDRWSGTAAMLGEGDRRGTLRQHSPDGCSRRFVGQYGTKRSLTEAMTVDDELAWGPPPTAAVMAEAETCDADVGAPGRIRRVRSLGSARGSARSCRRDCSPRRCRSWRRT